MIGLWRYDAQAAMFQYRPLSLPRVPHAQQLTANLIADPITPTAYALLAAPVGYPSLLRRSRYVQGGAHFSFVTPLPLSFPYDFPPPDEASDETLGMRQCRSIEADARAQSNLAAHERATRAEQSAERRMEEVEGQMRRYCVRVPPVPGAKLDPVPPGRAARSWPSARLVAFSPQAHATSVPHLDVGDAAAWIVRTSGQPHMFSSGPAVPSDGQASAAAAARVAFSDWAAGRSLYVDVDTERVPADSGPGVRFFSNDERDPQKLGRYALEELARKQRDAHVPYGPYALRYGGHQFGEWAGQLGDGRAVTLIETRHPVTQERAEIQLKGAGRTPYSRFGDGLATLKSSVREFLASEYMAALGVPTSRSLCVVSLPDVPVLRETLTSAAINMRIATSWLRIGSFQIHSARGEWESVRILGEFVARVLYGWADVVQGVSAAPRPPWALRLVREAAMRHARTCALWQGYGFMHGVLNTDNFALTGETIDYGPYGFMDLFDEDRVCNHSDVTGRYSYRMQPTCVLYAAEKLFDALAPLVGFELVHERAPAPGELLGASAADVHMWADHATSEALEGVLADLRAELQRHWVDAWSRRLGVRASGDVAALVESLVEALVGLDLGPALRALCDFPAHVAAGRAPSDFVSVVRAAGGGSDARAAALAAWLDAYAAHLRADAQPADEVAAAMRAANPAFVLRNWVTNEAADRLEREHDTRFLERVRAMCAAPFEPYGIERAGVDAAAAGDERRLLAVGEQLSANLPSCSS